MTPPRKDRIAPTLLVSVLLLLSGLAVYGQVAGFPFVPYDDDRYITGNPAVQGGLTLAGIRWAFTTFHLSNWHPLTWLSLMADASLFGMDAGAFHLVNLLFHLANTLLLYHVFRRMTGRTWESAMVAALFAVHPLHVESVAWVAERKDVLSTFFWFLAMGAYARHAERPGTARYAVLSLFFAFGLLSKPMLVTLPFALLLLDYWPLNRFTRHSALRLILEKLPLVLLSAISCVVTFIAQRSAMETGTSFPLGLRIGNALLAYPAYLSKAAWPSGLAVFYPHPGAGLVSWKVALAGLLLLGITALAIRQARSRGWFAMGWFWFLGTLVPVIGIVQVGAQAMADRYAYVPLTGIFVIAAWEGGEVIRRHAVPPRVAALFAATVIAAFSICARQQVTYWRGAVPLFGHAVMVTKDNWVAHSKLGNAASLAGMDEEALAHYREVLRIIPGDAHAEYSMYSILDRLGRKEEALRHFRAGLRANGDASRANSVGMDFAGSGKIEEAAACFEEAVRLRPDYADAHYNLADALGRLGKRDEAIPHFREALKIPPADADAHNRIGVSLVRLGRDEEALAHFREALRIRPGDGDAKTNLDATIRRLKPKPGGRR